MCSSDQWDLKLQCEMLSTKLATILFIKSIKTAAKLNLMSNELILLLYT